MDLLTLNSTGGLPTLSLTTSSSWLPWGRVGMPPISPLMPVPIIQSTAIARKTLHRGHPARYSALEALRNALYKFNTYLLTGGSGLAVACLTAVREVLESNRAAGSCVYRTTTVIYSLGHGLCAPFLQ